MGPEIARTFVANGAQGMLTARTSEGLDGVAAWLPYDRVAVHVADAGTPEDACACVRATIERFGRLDVLVNNAATSPPPSSLIDTDLATFDDVLRVNLRGPLVWAQEAWRQWMRENGGTVLNIASAGGLKRAGISGSYEMTKAALIFQTRQLAKDLGPSVRVNAMPPGSSERTSHASDGLKPNEAGYRWPLRRIGFPSDVASAALWLTSDAANWVTGE